MNVKLFIDNNLLEALEGTTLLQACLSNGIFIPNLCFLEGMARPEASCRMCWVEVEGEKRPVPSCTVTVAEGMRVHTDTAAVRRLQKAALALLLSVHEIDCKNCPSNRRCVLQDMAKFLSVGLKAKRFQQQLGPVRCDQSHPCIDLYPNRCILCGKCLLVCKNKHGKTHLSFARRGFETRIAFYGHPNDLKRVCQDCHACVDICPVSALLHKST